MAAVKGAREMRRPRGTYYASALGRGGFDRHLALALALSQQCLHRSLAPCRTIAAPYSWLLHVGEGVQTQVAEHS